MNHLNRGIGIAIAILIGAFLTQSLVYANNDKDSKSNARHSRIVGIWDVVVMVDSCGMGPTFEFPALHKYELGGTGQVVPATSPTILSEHSMIWSHVRGNDYRTVVKMFRFNPAGENNGWIVLRNDVSISEDGTNYWGSGMAEIFNLNGDVVATSCPSFSGVRFS